jgi:signal peptidase I
MKKERTWWQKTWHFLWHEDSVASWLASVVVAFILIKFVIYPLLGLLFGTQFPVVAVVSNSMEHDGSFDDWWQSQEDLYLQFNITRQEFEGYKMENGFNKGDIILLLGSKPEKIKRGDIIVYWGGKEYPIIHRVVALKSEKDSTPYFMTKGDHNRGQIVPPPECARYGDLQGAACLQNLPGQCCLNEQHVSSDVLLGKAVLRVPLLGWVKIWFVSAINWSLQGVASIGKSLA